MDFGAAAEGVALAHNAFRLFTALSLHTIAVVLVSFAFVSRPKTATLLSLSAVLTIAVNHIWLLCEGVWRGAVFGGALVWTLCIFTAAIYTVVMAVYILHREYQQS